MSDAVYSEMCEQIRKGANRLEKERANIYRQMSDIRDDILSIQAAHSSSDDCTPLEKDLVALLKKVEILMLPY